ncbi:MAG: hypothetical protein LBC97_00630 [Bifidobacteriaceae bacterium]|jgi:hypothetical protein|nr:hypothetical protein [Bifidobacteriaceae bacterium]
MAIIKCGATWRRVLAALAAAGALMAAAGCAQTALAIGSRAIGGAQVRDEAVVRAEVEMIAKEVEAYWVDAGSYDAGPTLVLQDGNWYMLGDSWGDEVGARTLIAAAAEGVEVAVHGTSKSDWCVEGGKGDVVWHVSAQEAMAEGWCP